MTQTPPTPASPSPRAGLVEVTGRNPRFVFWSIVLLFFGLSTIGAALLLGAVTNDTKWHEALVAITALVNLVFLAVAGGYSLWKYTKHDKVKSDLQHEMALNIELTVEAVPHGKGWFVRPIVPVGNVSTNKFGIPQVCFTVFLVPRAGLKTHRSWDDSFEALYGRPITRNINAYSNMPGVKPQERESFTGWMYFDEDVIDTHPTVIVQVDVVGVKEQGTFATKEARAEFMAWMKEVGGRENLVFDSWSADDVQEIKAAREQGRLWNGVNPKEISLNRCLKSKSAGANDYAPDYVRSAQWGDVLEDSVMWDRYAIVSLVDGRVIATGPGRRPE
ncbi:MAG TPA: hypothetical protein VD866_30955 [Urbifossiella sp.]|nr:hypothetical protein [Urbifossiella sp.]